MTQLIYYYLLYYLRSYRFFSPVATFLIFIIVFYTYRPNPAIDSYTVTASALYFIMAWLSLGFFAVEPPIQQQITLIHSKSFLRNYMAKIFTLLLIATALIFVSFLYPIIFHLLDEPLTLKIGLFLFFHHLLASLLGIALASLFQRDLIQSLITSIGGLTLVLLASYVYIAFTPFIPEKIDFLFYLFPPAYKMIEVLMKWNGTTLEWSLFLPFLHTTIYIGFLFLLSYFLLKRKRHFL